MKVKSFLSFIVVACITAGCSTTGTLETQKDVEKLDATAKEHLQASVPSVQARPVVVEHDRDSWVLDEEIAPLKHEPVFFNKSVYFAKSGDVPLQEVSTWVMSNLNVISEVDHSVYMPLHTQNTATGFATPTARPGSPAPLVPPPLHAPLAGATAGTSMSFTGVNPHLHNPTYSGTFKGFLDWAAAQMDVYWKYSDDKIVFFRTETKTFTLPNIPIVSEMDSGISTNSQGGGIGAGSAAPGGMGGAGQSISSGSGGIGVGAGAMGAGSMAGAGTSMSGGGYTTMTTSSKVDYWEAVEKTAKSVAGAGANVVVDKSFGTVTVTGTPMQISQVSQWIKGMTQVLSKQVGIEVKIYNVQRVTNDNYGFNPTLGMSLSAKNLGLSLQSAGAPTITSGSSPMQFGATILSGPAQGSNIAVQALSTLGHVSQSFARSGVTMNGQMLALQSANIQNYLASSQTTTVVNAGTTTSLTPGSLVTGFTGAFLPKVSNGEIFIDFNLTISNLISLTTFSTGTGANQSSIQIPQIASTTLQQVVGLKPGQSLVLTGFRAKEAQTSNNGTITPDNYALGGGVNSQDNDNILAVVITAKLL